jgi:hypothetical protein
LLETFEMFFDEFLFGKLGGGKEGARLERFWFQANDNSCLERKPPWIYVVTFDWLILNFSTKTKIKVQQKTKINNFLFPIKKVFITISETFALTIDRQRCAAI